MLNCVNLAKVEGGNIIGGLVGYANVNDGKSKIINSFNIGDIFGTQDVAEILGKKIATGKYYIINSFGLDNGKTAYNINQNDNDLEATNCTLYIKDFMKTETFLKTLNDYVIEYNKGEKTDSGSREILEWKFDDKIGYPTLKY